MRHLIVLFVLIAALGLAPAAANAETVMTAAEVVAIDRAFDGTRITFEGEAVGEDLRADADHRWVNLLSGDVGLGVYLTSLDASTIGAYGSYMHSGDVVRATGLVNIACDQHAGEFDVHAERVQIIERGAGIEHRPAIWKGIAGLLLALAGLYLWWYFGKMLEREPA